MKANLKAPTLIALVAILTAVFASYGWAQEMKISNDEMNIIDLLIARPLGFVAAAAGTCLFIASLPFTLPTRSTEDAFNMFVVEPWKFSFVRDFPDESTD